MKRCVFHDRDGHAVLDAFEEFVAQTVDRRHTVGRPDRGKDRAGCGQRIDRLREQQRPGVAVDDGGIKQHHAACGRADGLRQAERHADRALSVKLGVVLVGADVLAPFQPHRDTNTRPSEGVGRPGIRNRNEREKIKER